MSTISGKVLCVISMPLGDSVCAIPEIRFLAKRHGRPVDVLIKNPSYIGLYSGLDFIERIFLVRRWRFWPSFLFHMLPLLRRGKYEYVYFFDGPKHMCRFLWVLACAGHPPRQIRWDILEAVCENSPPPSVALGPSRLVASDREREEVRCLLGETYGWNGEALVLFHPGSSYVEDGKRKRRRFEGNTRQWPIENWQKTLSGIRRLMPEAWFVFTGTAKEHGLMEEILSGVAEKATSMAGKLSLRQFLALQSIAHSCIAIDTGAAHTALALGCPTVILYDFLDPRLKGRCSPKGWGSGITLRGFRNSDELKTTGCNDPIKNIQPETVIRLWKTLPPRPPEPPHECFISHYCEGDTEPEILPLLF